MIQLLTAKERYIQRASTPANRQLNKRTQPNARGFVSRMGYNTACTSYTDGTEIGLYSGSSLNRFFAKKRKDELQKVFEAQAQKDAATRAGIEQTNALRKTITGPGRGQADKLRIAREFPGTHDRCGNPLHVFSRRSKGKLRDKCTAFFRSCGVNKTFLTVTFISAVTDKQAVEVLNKFFTQVRDDMKKTFKYIWVAERQDNGNIHFHCIVNVRLPVRRYNALWVLQQYNAGIEFEGISRDEILQRYENDTIHKVLNPLDVKNITSIYGLSWYVTKYVSKNKSTGFSCLAWHCSREVSKLFTKKVITRSCMSEVTSLVNSRVDKKTGELIIHKMVKGNFYQLYYIENKLHFVRELSDMEKINEWILEGMPPDEIPAVEDFEFNKLINGPGYMYTMFDLNKFLNEIN